MLLYTTGRCSLCVGLVYFLGEAFHLLYLRVRMIKRQNEEASVGHWWEDSTHYHLGLGQRVSFKNVAEE
jgi:hypothetical protein